MSDKDKITALEKKYTFFNNALIVTIGLTFIFSMLVFYYQSNLDTERKNYERERDSRLDEANRQAEKERNERNEKQLALELELERIKSSIRHRILPANRIQAAQAKLSKLKGTSIELLYDRIENREVESFLQQLTELFGASGLVIKETSTKADTIEHYGLQLFIEPDNKKMLNDAGLIQLCFRELGFDCKIEEVLGTNVLELYIGSKPQPAF